MKARLAAAMTMSAAILAATAHAANCPVSECNYLDPQYRAAMDGYFKCVGPIADAFEHAMDQLAILYPRFGVAWQSQQAELKSAASDPGNPQLQTTTDEAQRRFEDRILRTAESEALQIYNLWTLKVKQVVEGCGRMPEPPKKQP